MININNTLIAICISLAVITGYSYSLSYKSEQELKKTNIKLEACRTLATDIDQLLAETDQDRQDYATAVYEALSNKISTEKFGEILDGITPRVEQRIYKYNLTLDKYNSVCFNLDSSGEDNGI